MNLSLALGIAMVAVGCTLWSMVWFVIGYTRGLRHAQAQLTELAEFIARRALAVERAAERAAQALRDELD